MISGDININMLRTAGLVLSSVLLNIVRIRPIDVPVTFFYEKYSVNNITIDDFFFGRFLF